MPIPDFSVWLYRNRKISQRFFNKFKFLKKKKEKLKKRWAKHADVFKIRLRVFLFREGENIFCEGIFPTSLHLPIGWLFQILKISWKSQESILWIKPLGYSDFLKDSLCTEKNLPTNHER